MKDQGKIIQQEMEETPKMKKLDKKEIKKLLSLKRKMLKEGQIIYKK